ncbi:MULTISPECIES: hypothetical protein [unclassified Pseudomonas]|uniref:hypothetical protein n=1 Tax=unclassified Pseudomonas TaxID=196821 RepID=UPI0006D41073|nr:MULTISPECIES: hypothetical protein [unclassified Pseudomonas]
MVERTQSDELHTLYLEAQSRFDQFVMGATLAVCAYLAQSNPYEKLGWNLPTLYFASLLLFAAAALCGFKRIEQVVQTLRHNTDLLEAQEKGIKDKVKEARAASHRASKQTHYFYLARNTFLFLGLITYIAAKVLGPYVSS